MEPLYFVNRVLKQFYNINSEIPLHYIIAFLHCAFDEDNGRGLSIKDVREAVGFSVSSGSRAINYWTDKNRGEGQGLLMVESDPKDNRRSVITLTPRGKKFVRLLEGEIV